MQLLSEKKCCSLANFLWVQSRHQDCCIYKKNTVDKNSICIEAKCHLWKKEKASSSNYHFSFLSGKFQPCPKFYSIASSTCCGGIFTLFCSFPSLCLSCLKISCCKCQTFFSPKCDAVLHTAMIFLFYTFFLKALWLVLPQCVTVWRKNQQINDLYWLTIFRKNWKIAFWSALCSAGC